MRTKVLFPKGAPMGNRGPQSFKKRQKEQQRKEKQQEKFAKRLERKNAPPATDEQQNDEQQNLDIPEGSAAPDSEKGAFLG
jgi:hypothetical protein